MAKWQKLTLEEKTSQLQALRELYRDDPEKYAQKDIKPYSGMEIKRGGVKNGISEKNRRQSGRNR